MFKIKFFFVFVFFSALININTTYSQIIEKNGYSIEVGEVPDWADRLKPNKEKKIKNRDIKSGQRYELINKLEKNTDGTRHYYQQVASTPVKQNGLSIVSDISIDFNPEFQTLKLHYISVIRDGKEISKLDVDDINLIRREEELESSIYNGIVTLSIQLKDIKLDDVVDYAYTVSGSNPIYENRIFGSLSLGWSIPVEKIRVGVYLPSKKLKVKLHESELEPVIKKTQHGYFYEVVDERAHFIESEGSTPVWYNPYPWLQYSEFKSWREVNKWALDLFSISTELDANLKQRISEIKISEKNNESKILQAIKLVQEEVRYFGIEIGINSHKPHDPVTVFERKYGDCKDKTILLNTILAELGIKAVPALVSTDQRQYLDMYLATPNAFNHVISKVYFNDKVYWIDGTQTFQAGELSEYDNRWFERALSVEKGTRTLDEVVPEEKSIALDVLEEIKVINKQGDVHLTVTTVHRHSHADSFRQRIASSSFNSIADSYTDYYSRLFEDAELLGETQYTDDELKNEIIVVEKYLIDGFLDKETHESPTYNIYASQIGNYTELPEKLKRTMPLWINYPLEVKHRIDVSFFENIDLYIPEKLLVVTDVLNFESSAKKKGNGISYIFNYRTLKKHVPVEAVPEHIKSLKKINDAIDTSYYYVIDETEKPEGLINIFINSLLEE